MKIEQLGLLATPILAFAALVALILTGQAGIGQHLRAFQTDTLTGQAGLHEDRRAGHEELREKMRTGQIQLREDLAALGVRLAVVEHRTDALEVRSTATEHQPAEPCEAVDCPGS